MEVGMGMQRNMPSVGGERESTRGLPGRNIYYKGKLELGRGDKGRRKGERKGEEGKEEREGERKERERKVEGEGKDG